MALSLEEAEVISATREAANRLTNCDRANLGRTSAAAHRQRTAKFRASAGMPNDVP